jgi:proteasome lid subunit RPN8/RPN11
VRPCFAFWILYTDRYAADILAHLQEQRIEMGGLLLGTVYEGLNGGDAFVVGITNFARSVDFDGRSVSLRMDPDVWQRARASADRTTVVGWYHSHPDLGVFFSGTDRRTQRAFFNQPQSIGLVRDWSDTVKSEMALFPKGRYKDLTDSATQALKWMRVRGLIQRPEDIALLAEARQEYRRNPVVLYRA